MLTVLITITALVAVAACGSDPDGGPPAAGASPSTASPSAVDPAVTPPSSATSAPPPATGTAGPTAAARPARPSTTGATPPSSPDSAEVPGGLPFGDRKLAGVVERLGDCVLLRVGERLWGLTGGPVRGLQPGDQVSVQGQVTTADAGCTEAGATRGMVVRRVAKV